MTKEFTTDHNLRVLLVDDHDDMLAMMQVVMAQRRFAVATANSGSKALEIAANFSPHLVISDIGMPGMDGCEMMETLRRMELSAPFKAIALTGYDMDEDREQVRNAGYDAHLSKPIDFDSLFDMIDRLLLPHAAPEPPKENS